MNCQSIKQSLDSIIDSADETTKEKILTDLKQLSNDMKQTLGLHNTSRSESDTLINMYDMLKKYHSNKDQRSMSLESGISHKMKSETIPTPFNSYNQEYKLVFNLESSPSFGSILEINPSPSPVLSYHPAQSPKLSFMLQ
jgi:hypothetical protein